MIIITLILHHHPSQCGVWYRHHIKIQVMQVGSDRKKKTSSYIADAWEHFLSPHLSSKRLLSGNILLVTYLYKHKFKIAPYVAVATNLLPNHYNHDDDFEFQAVATSY